MENNTANPEQKNRKAWRKYILIIALLLIFITIWLSYPNLIMNEFLVSSLDMDDSSWAVRGQIGDSFGALNTLLSAFGIAGLALNIYLQNEQIKNLEEKEEENTKKIDTQLAVLSYSALLNHYSLETQRLSQELLDLKYKASKFATVQIEDEIKMATIEASIKKYRKDSKEIVKKIQDMQENIRT